MAIAKTRKPLRRQYNSVKRAAQAAESKEKILKALVAQLNEEGLNDFSVPKVAKRAGFSLRTIYRHFANRKVLLEALSREVKSTKQSPALFPQSPSQMVELPFKLYPYYDSNAPLTRAQIYSELGRAIRALVTPTRRKMFEKALKDVTSTLSERQAQQIDALFHLLIGNTAWLHFRETWGLSSKEAAEMSSWASRLVLNELMRVKFSGDRSGRNSGPIFSTEDKK